MSVTTQKMQKKNIDLKKTSSVGKPPISAIIEVIFETKRSTVRKPSILVISKEKVIRSETETHNY